MPDIPIALTGISGVSIASMDDRRSSHSANHAEKVAEIVASRSAAARSPVAASWVRSFHKYGLEPDAPGRTGRLSQSEVGLHREAIGRLFHVSQAVMDQLHASLGLAGCSVILCDADGIVLDQRLRAGDQQDFETAGLARGADWSEKRQGTNGIGTAIAEGRPVHVLRDQHYHTRNTSMICLGAPVFGETGKLAAVLDVSSCRGDLDAAFVALIAQTVEQAAMRIEAENFCRSFSQARIVQGTAEGQQGPVLLAVNGDDLVIGATRSARLHYGLDDAALISPRPAMDILGDQERRGMGLESAERRELRRALARANGNVSAAARLLGISRATLYRRMEKLGLLPES
ncbi:GAF domain-containing protein [Hyphomonas sp. CACIAM 19H1]|uniref:GAF domain-containing protein n=1 Tax=Hyphomonas sp. CACIAM 19H1 TaxID=1873716 RepID=UPI001F29181E|nr:GAF domain-containing protein [Hyphomonas sp. CACIAM 19H1]